MLVAATTPPGPDAWKAAFQAAVDRDYDNFEVAERLASLGCRQDVAAEAEDKLEATQFWRTPSGRLFTVPTMRLPSSVLQDLLLTVRELDR